MTHPLESLRALLVRTTAETVDDPEDILVDIACGAHESIAAIDALTLHHKALTGQPWPERMPIGWASERSLLLDAMIHFQEMRRRRAIQDPCPPVSAASLLNYTLGIGSGWLERFARLTENGTTNRGGLQRDTPDGREPLVIDAMGSGLTLDLITMAHREAWEAGRVVLDCAVARDRWERLLAARPGPTRKPVVIGDELVTDFGPLRFKPDHDDNSTALLLGVNGETVVRVQNLSPLENTNAQR